MTEPERKRGRTHDAEGARQAILNAAEEVFAEHGFDGARVDAIAAAAGYNKSLIFQYFEDKLGLYAAMIRRADDQTRSIQSEVIAALIDDETLLDPGKLRALLKTYLSAYFDFLVEHPRFMKVFLWEMAEGWKTYSKILTQRDYDDVQDFQPLLQKLQDAGLLRPGFNPTAQVILIEFLIPSYLALGPLYQAILPGKDFSSSEALAPAREYIVEFAIRGLLNEVPQKTPQAGK